MQKKILIASLLLSLLIIGEGCETKSQTGGLFGAGTGALIGSSIAGGRNKTAGAVIGAVLGAAVGSEIGRYMDEQDKMKARETSQRAMEYSRSGATSSWRNPDSGHSGTITPQRTYQDNDGQYCREYTQTVTIGGKTERGYGTACRQPDGQWKVVS